jgi:hypothetical protein
MTLYVSEADDDNYDLGLSGYIGIFPRWKDTGSDYLAGSLMSLNISSISSLNASYGGINDITR